MKIAAIFAYLGLLGGVESLEPAATETAPAGASTPQACDRATLVSRGPDGVDFTPRWSSAGTVANSAQACRDACYAKKSEAYRQCRAIAPTERAERNRCFNAADAALRSCLRNCG